MLHPLRLITQQAFFGVLFLMGLMLLCAALLSPVVMSATANFGY